MIDFGGIQAGNNHEWRQKARASARAATKCRKIQSVPTLAESQAADERRRIKIAAENPEWSAQQVSDFVAAKRARLDARFEKIFDNNDRVTAETATNRIERTGASVAVAAFPSMQSSGIKHENLDNAYDREIIRIRRHERRLALSSTAPDQNYTPAQWASLCADYDNLCACCGREEKLTVDHIIPVSKGGRNSIENIQPLCKSCNSSKGTKKTDYRVH